MPSILWVGDGVVKTGFETVSRGFLNELQNRHAWDVHHLAIGASGDPAPYSWDVYPAHLGGDHLGVERIGPLYKQLKPDVIVISGDSWTIPLYTRFLPKEAKVVAYCPVDAPNQIAGSALNRCSLILAPTHFGCREIEIGGYEGKTQAISYGINADAFQPMAPVDARKALGMPEVLQEAFIIGNVNRNAPRKRIDLTMVAFRRYVDKGGKGYLLLHMNARDSWGWDLLQLAERFGISNRLILTGGKQDTDAAPFERLKLVYAALGMQVSTTVGEGFGLTTAEGMASGIMQTVPDYSALGEWARGGVRYYEITDTQVAPGQINTIWATPDVNQLADIMLAMEHNPDLRTEYAIKGYNHIRQEKFSWESVGTELDKALTEVIA